MDFRRTKPRHPESAYTDTTLISSSGLFVRQFRVATLCFFGATFLCLFMIYAINIWLPQIRREAGYSLGGSLTSILVFNVGAAVGTVLVGAVADRLGTRNSLIGAFALSTSSVAAIGFAPNLYFIYVLIALAGIGATGGQTLIISLLSQTYPHRLATVGIGWTLGTGRLGSIAALIALGMLVGAGFDLGASTMTLAVAGGLAIVLIVLIPKDREVARAPAAAPRSFEAVG